MDDITAGFIGFGLIGGSIARAMKSKLTNTKIIAYNHHGTANKSLELARKDRTIDIISTDLEKDFAACNIIFLCCPVLTNIEYLKQLKPIITSDCIITDVGSVKGNIHNAVTMLGMCSNFIGGHPMAGSEQTGYENSSAQILENAYYVLTPSEDVAPQKIEFLTTFVKTIGSLPLLIDYNKHDDIVAAISHVPHVIASSLVNLVKDSDDESEQMRLLAAGGFKDITRIASSSSIMWQNICLTNQKSIEHFLNKYIDVLSSIRDSIKKADETALYDFFDSAKEYRDCIPSKKAGILQEIYEVYLDIIDETGAIATIATILASNNISIKNIGIIHNREFEQGVLRIEFNESNASEKALALLKKYNYTIYERK